jgi:hypothetical protein
MAVPQRITVTPDFGAGNSLEFFITTGAFEPPLACLADNDGFPQVHQLYARQAQYHGLSGIHITVTFDAPAAGVGLAVNVYQTGMVGPYDVHNLAWMQAP